MISYLQRHENLRKSISVVALLAALPNVMVSNAAMAQQVVVTQDETDGLSYSDIISFTNPGFSITNYGGTSGVDIDSVEQDFNNSGFVAGDSYGVFISSYVGGDFTNSGTMEGSYGVLVDGEIGGNFTNSGNITGTEEYGVWIYDDIGGNFTNTSSGNIWGESYSGAKATMECC